MRVVIFVALLVLSLAAPTPVPWTNCGSSADHLKIKSVTADPYPPVKGQDLTVAVTGDVDEEVSGGKYDVEVKVYGIKVFGQTGNVCDLDPDKFKCPVAAGEYSMTQTQAIPSYAPSGKYDIKFTATDQNGQELICAQAQIKM